MSAGVDSERGNADLATNWVNHDGLTAVTSLMVLRRNNKLGRIECQMNCQSRYFRTGSGGQKSIPGIKSEPSMVIKKTNRAGLGCIRQESAGKKPNFFKAFFL